MQLCYKRYPVGKTIAGESTAPAFSYDPERVTQDGAFQISTMMPEIGVIAFTP